MGKPKVFFLKIKEKLNDFLGEGGAVWSFVWRNPGIIIVIMIVIYFIFVIIYSLRVAI